MIISHFSYPFVPDAKSDTQRILIKLHQIYKYIASVAHFLIFSIFAKNMLSLYCSLAVTSNGNNIGYLRVSIIKIIGMDYCSNRIFLRRWEDSDAGILYEYASDPQVGPRAGWAPHKSLDESLEIIRTVFRNDTTWAIV